MTIATFAGILGDTHEIGTEAFAQAVIQGLSQRQKIIPARYFYDKIGSELFEDITRVPEYYPTRTEIALLAAHADDIARLTGTGKTVVEFGSGSSTKTPLLLSAVSPDSYVPIDISGHFLELSMQAFAQEYPHIAVHPIAADFTHPVRLPAGTCGPLIGFFPGSTIGNFAPAAAVDLLRSFRDTLGAGAKLVIGIDILKNVRLLEAAYDDAAGVTAQFNLNVLARINRELGGTIPLDSFAHRAVWHDGLGRIEMHLEALKDLDFRAAGQSFRMRRHETIHTENSYKYPPEAIRLLARAAGWEPLAAWFDPDRLFSIHVWTADEDRMEP
ncbi:MAG: L-histidine N(alpha)-methyltransferase [Pseudomonadota bacterium]|nr:L-histidine N(alpha)-methyltransferase [Pseudomonadota bacterium]